MKLFTASIFLILLMACRNTGVATVDSGSEPKLENRMEGVVHLSEECGLRVDVIQGDVLRSYSPVFLDERFRVEGMRLRFTMKPTKGKPPKGCPNFIVCEFGDVTPLRS